MSKFKSQQLEVNELIEWVSKSSTMYAKCSISDKELKVAMNGSFQVYHKGEIVLECIQPFRAVEKYNSL